MDRFIFKDIHINWLKSNFNLHTNSKKLVCEFNKKFNLNKTVDTIRALCSRYKLLRNTQQKYSKKHDEWMRTHHESKSRPQLVKDFNAEFGTRLTSGAYSQRCINIGLLYDNPNVFGNKVPPNRANIGAERREKDGYVLIKVQNGKWINKARFIYESQNGKVEKGYQVIQLDGDKNNFDIGNLACIPVKHMVMLNRNNWLGKGEISKTALYLCQLKYSIKEDK